ncbi:hypothetical protein PISMIDRAFT_606198 [Pisolithus microcarpus 441]|uniref:Uncharacterized protein n=1 Tax=Pisolithus microcarpus 441 TaxID=765257 RepID=A0A0C9ZFR1_9AGAM|nr:hypothetical protein PISMIDRAFT_606198 [Pisolithus microcarpus 441]
MYSYQSNKPRPASLSQPFRNEEKCGTCSGNVFTSQRETLQCPRSMTRPCWLYSWSTYRSHDSLPFRRQLD